MNKVATIWKVGRTFGVRHGMLRLEYELQRGSGLMSWKMRAAEGWEAWQLERIAPGVSAGGLLRARRGGRTKFFFDDVGELRQRLKAIVGSEGERQILEGAEGVLRGNLPFFGAMTYCCGSPPRWFENPATKQSVWPRQRWTQMRFASPVYGDLKFILEASRFLFVYPLVRAYALSGDERFAEVFWAAVEDWARCSPPMSGPLWICGQECSLRIVAWSFGLQGFMHSAATTAERVSLLTSMIAAHAWRTAQTMDYARSQRSNHLISEAVGLWTAGTLYPELSGAAEWRNLGEQVLYEAAVDQITPEGVSQQHSFNYQRMILHLLMWTLRLGEIYNAPLREEIRKRAERAFDFIRGWVDATSGCVPNFGADDGSLIFPLAGGAYRDYRPLVQVGASVLKRVGLPAGPWDEAAVWFGAERKAEKKEASAAGSESSCSGSAASSPATPDLETSSPGTSSPATSYSATSCSATSCSATSCSASETGYFRLGNKDSWALIRAGKYERRAYQADQLHVDLWERGMNLARDPGTYLYNGPAPWQNAFAGTAVHNTVTVDGDQMRRAGRFLWLDSAQASGQQYRSGDSDVMDRFEGEHDGYKHIGVIHRREVRWLGGAGWIVIDDVEGAGEHDLRVHWLTPDLAYEVQDCESGDFKSEDGRFQRSPFRIQFKAEKMAIRWSIFASGSAQPAVIRAGKVVAGVSRAPERVRQLLGWEGKTYGDLSPAVSLISEARAQVPFRFVTVLLSDEKWRVEWNEKEARVFASCERTASGRESPRHRVSLLPNSVSTGSPTDSDASDWMEGTVSADSGEENAAALFPGRGEKRS